MSRQFHSNLSFSVVVNHSSVGVYSTRYGASMRGAQMSLPGQGFKIVPVPNDLKSTIFSGTNKRGLLR